MATAGDPAIGWLLRSDDPSVRYLTLTEVLREAHGTRAVDAAQAAIPAGRRVRALLRGQARDGGFGVHPYKKWQGAHWRLVSLVELAAPRSDARLRAAAEDVLRWLSSEHRRFPTIDGRVRRCASQEGNALAVCSRLGLSGDRRVRALAESLVATQWPDGGWNCDRRVEASSSSFYESLTTMWGLAEYAAATGDVAARDAAVRAAELFLRRRVFRSLRTGDVIDADWIELHYPLYWHYDVLHALLLLARVVGLGDPRLADALDVVERKRRDDGLWWVDGSYWRAPGAAGSNVEVVDWGRRGPNEMLTLNAVRVLAAPGRLRV